MMCSTERDCSVCSRLVCEQWERDEDTSVFDRDYDDDDEEGEIRWQ